MTITTKKLTIAFLALFFLIGTKQISANCTYSNELLVEEFEMGNMLSWATASEQDNKHFVIEKSIDGGVSFMKIGKVKGNGTTSSENSYRFLDVSASKGTAHYRLKQVDANEKFNYSKVSAIVKEGGNNFTVISMTTPTEVEEIFEVTVNAVVEDVMQYKVFDMDGNLVYKQTQKLNKGVNIISVDMAKLNEQLENTRGFAGNNELLGNNVGYRVSLEGQYEAEMLTIPPRNRNISKSN